jgi:hypothetical protein
MPDVWRRPPAWLGSHWAEAFGDLGAHDAKSTAGLIVEVPRGLARLTIDVDGEVFFVKDDAGARLLVPGADSGSDEFVFQARSR